MDAEHCTVFVTVADEQQALAVARAVLDRRLAACVNIVPGVRSLYRWEGEIHDDPELLCVMKTRAELFDALAGAVRAAHAYDVPEIIALPIINGNPAYLKWIDDNVG